MPPAPRSPLWSGQRRRAVPRGLGQLDAQLSGALVDVDERLDPRGDVRDASRADVERGVVLGRYTRCHRTTALAGDDRVSRVHALLFAANDALWVVDTASTLGTQVRAAGGSVALGEGHRIVRLAADARLFLAGVEALLVVDG